MGQPKGKINLLEASGVVHRGGLGIQRSTGTDYSRRGTFRREAPLAGLFHGTGDGSYPHHQCSPRDEDRTTRLWRTFRSI